MQVALAEHGEKIWPFGVEGPEVTAVAESRVRTEFVAANPVGGETNEQRTDAKKAFSRALKTAIDRDLVVSRGRNGVDFLWLTDKADAGTSTRGTDGTLP